MACRVGVVHRVGVVTEWSTGLEWSQSGPLGGSGHRVVHRVGVVHRLLKAGSSECQNCTIS